MDINALQAAAFNAIDEPLMIIDTTGSIKGANEAFFARYDNSIEKVFKNKKDLILLQKTLARTLEEDHCVITLNSYDKHEQLVLTQVVIKKKEVNGENFLFVQLKNVSDFFFVHSNQSTVPLYIKDPSGRYLFVNESYSKLVDPSCNIVDLIGKTAEEFMTERTLNEQQKEFFEISLQREKQVKATNLQHIDAINAYDPKGQWGKFLGISELFHFGGSADGILAMYLGQENQLFSNNELQRSKNILQTIIDTVDEPLYIKNASRQILSCNEAYARQFNKKPAELIGQTNTTLIPSIAASLDGLEDMLLQDKDNPYNVSPLYDADGEPVGLAEYKVAACSLGNGDQGFVGHIHDITREKEREEALIDARRHLEDERTFLQQIIDSLPVPLYVKDKHGLFIKCNVNFAKTFGKTPIEIMGLSLKDLNISPDLAENIDQFDKHFAENPVTDSVEMFFIYPNGSPMRARGYYSPNFDRMGQYAGLACIIFDITEEWNLHKQLYDSEERWQFALKATNDAIWDYHFEDETFYYYSRFLEILHLPLDTPRQKLSHFEGRIHPDDYESIGSLYQFFVDQAKEGDSKVVELRMMCGDNIYRWMQVKALTISSPTGTPLRTVGVLSDISERKEHEDQVRFQATHDLLTGLPNRVYFHEELDKRLTVCAANQEQLAVCMLDLDGFKHVNDTMGHQEGDELLKVIAKRLINAVGSGDFVSRMGGDEFIFIISSIKTQYAVLETMNKVLTAIRKPILLDSGTAQVAGSIGIAFYPEHTTDDRTLIRMADEAMYHSKTRGRDRITTWQETFAD